MKFLEKDLEEIIFNAGNELLSERGLHLMPKLKRQLKIGNYGIADLIGFQRPIYYFENKCKFLMESGKIQIIELKNDKINVSAFLQAINYLKGIRSYLRKRNINPSNYIFEIVLIAKNIDKESSFIYLTDLLVSDNFELTYYTYDYNIDGISFNLESGYVLTNEGF